MTKLSDIEIVRSSIKRCDELPEQVLGELEKISHVDRSQFDQSYIEFLDEQIGLNARGDDWSEILRIRRHYLADYTNTQLLNATVLINRKEYRFKVGPSKKLVVHWECDA